MSRRLVGRVGLALLVVMAGVGGPIGLASGQVDAYEHTFTSNSAVYIVDFGSYEGQVNIQFTSPEVPGVDKNTVWAGTVSTRQIDNNRVRLVNGGAYENLTVTVTGPSSEPSYESSGPQFYPAGYSLGSTGGDVDMECSTGEQLSQVTGGADIIDCTGYPGIDSLDTSTLDATQVKYDLQSRAVDMQADSQLAHDTIDNRLEDARTVARIRGQNAYIRALNNGTSESSARYAAREAVKDHYALIQRNNVIQPWNNTVKELEYMHGVARNETGVSQYYIDADATKGDNNGYGPYDARLNYTADTATFPGLSQTESVTLVNGETVTSAAIPMSVYTENNNNWVHGDAQPISVADGDTALPDASNPPVAHGVYLKAPESGGSTQTAVDFSKYRNSFMDVESESQAVIDDLDILINNTYPAYQQGEINASDLVNPYTLAQEQSPGENYEGWAAAMLTSLGSNSPENFEKTGSVTIEINNTTREGIIFADENPAGGSYEAGMTYDPANISGTEWFVTSNKIQQLNQPFTVQTIKTRDGETQTNLTVSGPDYTVTNLTELREEYEYLEQQRAAVEAREKAVIANSGISAFSGGDAPVNRSLLLAAAAGLSLVILTRR